MLAERFRGMSTEPFKACALGRRTIIFGRNGSGKTTLSEVMRSVDASVSYNWADPLRGPTGQRFVFNRFYVQETLGEFVEGDGSAPPILKVGSANVRLARLESEQAATNERNVSWLRWTREAITAAQREREALIKRAKTAIINVLNPRDEVRFNTQAYTVRSVRAALDRKPGAENSEDSFAADCELMGMREDGARIVFRDPPSPSTNFLEVAQGLIAYNPVAATVDSLAVNHVLARWVEQGLDLHDAGDRCQFCADGWLSDERLKILLGHFSDDLDQFRRRLREHVKLGKDLMDDLLLWRSDLPPAEVFGSGLLASAQRELLRVSEEVDRQVGVMRGVIDSLAIALDDPFGTRAPLEPTSLRKVDVTTLRTLVAESNAVLDSLNGRKRTALRAIEDYLVSPERSAYRAGIEREARLEKVAHRLQRAYERGVIRVRALHAEQQDTTAMASEIDSDLRSHFGHGHLAVAATPDGKGYTVQRNGVAAHTLSEGERNALALAYFLQSLQGADCSLAEAIVIIDDPITSLDREAMFAAFALIEARTEGAGQLIVLTHDFEYFRLLLNSVSGPWGKSQKRIREGDVSEAAYPTVSVLEVRSVGSHGARATEVHPLPAVVVQRASEYHYLFWRVALAVQRDDSENLPLLGNAARRLLEGFISFKAPHGTSFQNKVDNVRDNYRVDPVLSRRVVKFLHAQSHREELRPTSAIDFPSVESELSLALEFIHQADGVHYRDMCKATGVENAFA